MTKISLKCLYCSKTSAPGVSGLRTSRSWQCSFCNALSRITQNQRAEIDARVAMIAAVSKRVN